MAAPSKPNVSTPNEEYFKASEERLMIRTILGGTKAMRSAGEMYLPKETGETEEEFKNRIKRSFFFNYFKKSVKYLVGKPFSKPVIRSEDIEEDLDLHLNDLDLQGNDVTIIARDWFEEAISQGIAFLLVDYPTVPEGATRADEKATNVRPYVVLFRVEDVIGWRSQNIDGLHVLTQIRLLTAEKEPISEYEERTYKVVRVFNCDPNTRVVSFQVWREPDTKSGSKEWTMIRNGVLAGMNEIPLVVLYAGQTGFMTAESPLLDLAYLNIAHWQGYSDYNQIVHVAQVPILAAYGWRDNEGNKMQVGANRLTKFPDPNAKLEYIEITGKGIEAGRMNLKDLEDRMMLMSIQLLASKTPGGVTATEVAVDTAAAESALKAMVTSLVDGLNKVIKFMGMWEGVEYKGTLDVNNDFGLMIGNDLKANWLLKANAQSIITKKTAGEEAKKVGYLSEDINVDEEVELAKEEQSELMNAMLEMEQAANPDPNDPNSDTTPSSGSEGNAFGSTGAA